MILVEKRKHLKKQLHLILIEKFLNESSTNKKYICMCITKGIDKLSGQRAINQNIDFCFLWIASWCC